MQTLLLDLTTWDLVIDANGNIAVANDPYSIAQDICSRVRLFLGELWYDTTQGIDYFGQVFGKSLNTNYLKSQIKTAALKIPNVTDATVYITSFIDRKVTGQIQFAYSVATANGAVSAQTLVITFVGDNGLFVTFIGSNTGAVSFIGSSSS